MTPLPRPEHPVTGLVLSGGGARGAYEAGSLAGLVDVLRQAGQERPAVEIFCGTSVGAINAAWIVGHCREAGWGLDALIDHWHALRFEDYVDVNLSGIVALARRRPDWSLLKAGALESLVDEAIDWDVLHANVREGRARALVVPALRVSDGKTMVFAELVPGLTFAASKDPRREPVFGEISADHVLASAAFPFFFPARRIGADYYCDGGLRFNTPIAPAIRCGADRLVVISLAGTVQSTAQGLRAPAAVFPSPMFLLGKVANALMLDPVRYDLEVLGHINNLVEVMESSVDDEARARIEEVHRRQRGISYRRIETLVLSPSRNVSEMAANHARTVKLRRASAWLLSRLGRLGTSWEADLLSFLMFDGGFARQLTELGYRDALCRRDDILGFFD